MSWEKYCPACGRRTIVYTGRAHDGRRRGFRTYVHRRCPLWHVSEIYYRPASGRESLRYILQEIRSRIRALLAG